MKSERKRKKKCKRNRVEYKCQELVGNLKKLCLRQNLIATLDPEIFSALTALEELDLYDNKLKGVDGALEGCTSMR